MYSSLKIKQSSSAQQTEDVLSHSSVLKRIKMLEERVEERTKRPLRKTFIFRDIKQLENERTWQDTENVLSKDIASLLSVEKKVSVEMIDRCHR